MTITTDIMTAMIEAQRSLTAAQIAGLVKEDRADVEWILRGLVADRIVAVEWRNGKFHYTTTHPARPTGPRKTQRVAERKKSGPLH